MTDQALNETPKSPTDMPEVRAALKAAGFSEVQFQGLTEFARVTDMTAGRWMVSQSDEYEGLFGGSWPTREMAIAAGPGVIRWNCGDGAKADKFYVGQLVSWDVQIPKSLPGMIAKLIHDETFENFEEPGELSVSPESLNLLAEMLEFWAKGANITRGETYVGSFEEVPWPTEQSVVATEN